MKIKKTKLNQMADKAFEEVMDEKKEVLTIEVDGNLKLVADISEAVAKSINKHAQNEQLKESAQDVGNHIGILIQKADGGQVEIAEMFNSLKEISSIQEKENNEQS